MTFTHSMKGALMLESTITLAYNDETPAGETDYVQISSGEFDTIRKDVSGDRIAAYSSRTLKVSQQYVGDNKRRILIRLDVIPAVSEVIPEPKAISVYTVLDFNPQDVGGLSLLSEVAFEMKELLASSNLSKIINGEF